MQCDQVLRINLSARPKNDIARKAVRESKNPKSAQNCTMPEDIELTCFQLEPVAFDMRIFRIDRRTCAAPCAIRRGSESDDN